MPRLDGTGPAGFGPKTGQNLGNCENEGQANFLNQKFRGQGRGRPRRMRRVTRMPVCRRFGPMNYEQTDLVNMTIDEYEVIRLIDELGLTQEEASKKMNVARTTVQSIYSSARKKLADFLINNKELFIDGGNYELEED